MLNVIWGKFKHMSEGFHISNMEWGDVGGFCVGTSERNFGINLLAPKLVKHSNNVAY